MDKKGYISKDFDLLVYEEDTQVYTQSQDIDVQRFCNGFTATVIGSDAVLVNGMLLRPSTTPLTVTGDSLSVGGNRGEIYGKRRIRIQFLTQVAPQLQVTQKYYQNIKDE